MTSFFTNKDKNKSPLNQFFTIGFTDNFNFFFSLATIFFISF